MYFSTKNYLKNNHYHTAKHSPALTCRWFCFFFLAHRDRLRIFRLSFVMSSGTNCVFYGLVCCRSVQAPVQQPWLALVVVWASRGAFVFVVAAHILGRLWVMAQKRWPVMMIMHQMHSPLSGSLVLLQHWENTNCCCFFG